MSQLQFKISLISIISHDCILFHSVLSDLIVYDEMVSNVTAVVHGDGVRFSLENPDACIISGLSCPLLKNKTHKYVQSLPVKLYYPPVNDRIKYIIGFKHFRLRIDVTIRWVLEDANTQKNIVCVLIPASIVYWVL